jgi:integrase
VAYDLMGRRSEVVALNRDDIRIHEEKRVGIAVIRRSKTDKKGEGKQLFLRADTCERLLHWMELAKIDDDDQAVFRSLKGFAASGRAKPRRRLPAAELSTVIRRHVRAAQLFGATLSGAEVEKRIKRFSGHSLRVGAAQDMVAAGMSDGDIMNTARWKNLGTLLRYTAAQRAERGGMAKLAAMQAGMPAAIPTGADGKV